MHPRTILLPILLAGLACTAAQGAEPSSREAQVFKAMLEQPVMPPLYAPVQESLPEEPDENGPLEPLIRHWSKISLKQQVPSPWVQERFLQACERDPELIHDLLWQIPPTPASARRIRALHDSLASRPDVYEGWLNALHDWLKYQTDTFRDELLQDIRPLFHGPTDTLDWEAWGALESLSKVDWTTARPLVLRAEAHPNPIIQAFGLCLRYEQAMKLGSESPDALRPRIMALAEDATQPVWTRCRAAGILCEYPWPGWEAWYLKRFKDPSLVELHHDGDHVQVLLSPAYLAPKRWIPDLLRMIEGTDPAARDNAIHVLLELPPGCLSAEELRPLLPWLLDPEWSRCSLRDQALHAMMRVRMPEAVPGMTSILASDPASSQAWVAAEFLIRNPNPAAIPFLQCALEHHLDTSECAWHQSAFSVALLACGGLSEEKALEMITALAVQLERNPKLHDSIEQREIPREVILGWHFLMNQEVRIRMAPTLFEHARKLEKGSPEVAEALRKLLWKHRVPEGDTEIVRRLGDSDLRLSDALAAVSHRDLVKQNHREALERFSQDKGWRGGMAAALLEDTARIRHLLAQGSPDARLALLATARLARVKLPAGHVALQSLEGRTLARAADLYLKAASGF